VAFSENGVVEKEMAVPLDGIYFVVVTNEIGCSSASESVYHKNLHFLQNSNEFYIEAPDLIPGLYHLQVVTGEKVLIGSKIIHK